MIPSAIFLSRAIVRARATMASPAAWLAIPFSAVLLWGLFGMFTAADHAMLAVGLGMQGVLAALSAGGGGAYRGGRGVVLLLGHAVAIIGHESLWRLGPTRITALAYGASMIALSLCAYWAHRVARDDGTLRSWEAPYLLGALVAGVGVAVAPFAPNPTLLATHLLLLGYLGSVALLAGPPHVRPAWRAPSGGMLEFATQSLALTLLLNMLLLIVVLRFPALAVPLLMVGLSWLAVAVVSEYVSVFARPPKPSATDEPRPPLTVVVSAMNEEAHIEATLRHALAIPRVERLVVALAARSKDRTRAIVESVAETDTRVRLEVGTGGSKAEDLTQAWRHVKTDIALLLDADERVDDLSHGLRVLRERPEVGIVQGRKAFEPEGALGLFIAVERRYSTLADHVAQDRLFGAGHFGGSAALIRREVPAAAGWWKNTSLTEDIEFTLRVHIDTPWHVAYEPRFVVWEEPPRDVRSLVRQRSRWARGWSQVSRMYLWQLPRANMPGKGKVGFGWQLITAISAPWSVFFPTLLALWIWGEPLQIPATAAAVLAFVILPSRCITYTVPMFRVPTPLRALPGVIVAAYAWVVVGWALQLHALYLELSAAPKTWHATRVR